MDTRSRTVLDWIKVKGKMSNESSVSKKTFEPREGSFSKAVRVESGRLYFISGESPVDENGYFVGKSGLGVDSHDFSCV